jgi:hypothetical protein
VSTTSWGRLFFSQQGEKMQTVKRIISQGWEGHRKAMLVTAAATWVLLIPLIYLALAVEPLRVGGLPVT